MNLERLFRPRTIAVYGGKWCDYVVEQCRKTGFSGEIWRVNPARPDCFASTRDLPGVPDSVFLGINREHTVRAFAELSAMGIGGAVLFASGFSEVADGQSLATQLKQVSKDIPFIGPNCYGFVNLFDRVALWPDQVIGEPLDRGVAIIGQSGTISLTLMYQRRSLPVGYVITMGNQQRLTAADLIRYVADDDRVSAIGMYIEGISDINAFVDAVDYAREKGKPIALIKAGRSEKGQALAQSHTGALTGSDALHDALFRRLGIARCHTLDELVETLKLLHYHGPLPSNRLAVAGASGGDITMISDYAKDMDIDFASPDHTTRRELDESTGPVIIDNPIDFHTYTWFEPEKMQRMFSAFLNADYALTAFILDPPDETLADPSTFDVGIDAMLAAAKDTGRTGAVLSSMPESLSKYTRDKCSEAGVAPMQGLGGFLKAFQHAAHIGKVWRHWNLPQVDPDSALTSTISCKNLNEHEGKTLLEEFGIATPERTLCSIDSAMQAAANLSGAVAIKAVRDGLIHKTELNGVALNLRTPEEVLAASISMTGITDTLLVEAMVEDGVAELIVGIAQDPQFGHFVTIGAGGVLAELLKDTTSLLLPFTREDVLNALTRLRVYRQIQGWRGKAEGDVDAVVDVVMALATIIEHYRDRLLELDINPLIVRPKGRGAIAVDTLVTIKEH